MCGLHIGPLGDFDPQKICRLYHFAKKLVRGLPDDFTARFLLVLDAVVKFNVSYLSVLWHWRTA